MVQIHALPRPCDSLATTLVLSSAPTLFCPPPGSTGNTKRYPLRCSVSTYLGTTAESPSAVLSFPTATFTAWSKSPNDSFGQILVFNSSRLTTSPGLSSSASSTLYGWSCTRIRTPAFRSSPERGSTSNTPNRIVTSVRSRSSIEATWRRLHRQFSWFNRGDIRL